MKPAEETFGGLSKFEWIMGVLTLAGVAIAFFTGLIFWKQLGQMRADERPWIKLTGSGIAFPKSEDLAATTQIVSNMTVNNIGKTPARLVVVTFVIAYQVNGSEPDLVYEGRLGQLDQTGIIFPNDPHPVPVIFINTNGPRFLTKSEYNDLQKGDAFIVVYAKATYLDIFGKSHWLRYCSFSMAPNSPKPATANNCAKYDDTDDN